VEFDAVDIDRLTVVAVLSLHLGCVIALGFELFQVLLGDITGDVFSREA